MKKMIMNLYNTGFDEHTIKQILFSNYGIYHCFYGSKLTPAQNRTKNRIIKLINEQFSN